jgi:hypothetical protein
MATVKQASLVQQQNSYATVLMTTNVVTLYTGPVILVGIHVSVALSAHACEIESVSGTSVLTIAASTAAGTNIDCFNMRLEEALIINPADAASAGTITVIYRPINPTFVDGQTVITPKA